MVRVGNQGISRLKESFANDFVKVTVTAVPKLGA